jgi:hypothetical protein
VTALATSGTVSATSGRARAQPHLDVAKAVSIVLVVVPDLAKTRPIVTLVVPRLSKARSFVILMLPKIAKPNAIVVFSVRVVDQTVGEITRVVPRPATARAVVSLVVPDVAKAGSIFERIQWELSSPRSILPKGELVEVSTRAV